MSHCNVNSCVIVDVCITFVQFLLSFFGFHLFLEFGRGWQSMNQKIESKVESHWQCVSKRLSQIHDRDPIRKLNSACQSRSFSRVFFLVLFSSYFIRLFGFVALLRATISLFCRLGNHLNSDLTADK